MNMQARLKAAKKPLLEPEPTTEAATEVELPPIVAKQKNLELDAASQELLEENPIVIDAGKPLAVAAPKLAEPVAVPPAATPLQNPLVLIGGALAAGLLILGGVMVSRSKPVQFYNPMPNDHAPAPVAPRANKSGLVNV